MNTTPSLTLSEDAKAFILKGGPIGVLLIHGFTGTPYIFRELGAELNELGYTVYAPMLAGHGTSVEDFKQTGWDDWYLSTKQAYEKLTETCTRVFVIGASFGANLALQLASEQDSIAGLLLIGAPRWLNKQFLITSLIPVLKAFKVEHFTKSFGKDLDKNSIIGGPNYSYSQIPISSGEELMNSLKLMSPDLLKKVTMPVLLIHSNNDGLVSKSSGDYYYRYLGSENRELMHVNAPHHQLHLGEEKKDIFFAINRFLKTWSE